MSIVATEIESIHGAIGQQRMIFYRCQDDQGVWHKHGPVITIDDAFDPEAHKAVVAAQMEDALADQEFTEQIEE